MDNIDSTTDLKVSSSSDGPKVGVASGPPMDVSETSSSVMQATSGLMRVHFRTSKAPIVMTSTNIAGDSLLRVVLDTDIDSALASAKNDYMFYKFDTIAIALHPVAPFSTASGSAQVYFNTDPLNPINSATTSNNLKAAMRLNQSKQVLAKGTIESILSSDDMTSPVYGSWRYSRTGSQRDSSFGELGVLVRTPPNQADVTTWSVTITGSVAFSNMTYNIPSALLRSYSQLNITNTYARNSTTGDGSTYIIFEGTAVDLNNNLPASAGRFHSDHTVYTTALITTNGYSERYNLEFDELNYVVTGDTVMLSAALSLIRNTDLEDLSSATVETGLTTLSGNFVYTVPGTSSINAIPISSTPQDYQTYKNSVSRFPTISSNEFTSAIAKYVGKFGNHTGKIPTINIH